MGLCLESTSLDVNERGPSPLIVESSATAWQNPYHLPTAAEPFMFRFFFAFQTVRPTELSASRATAYHSNRALRHVKLTSQSELPVSALAGL